MTFTTFLYRGHEVLIVFLNLSIKYRIAHGNLQYGCTMCVCVCVWLTLLSTKSVVMVVILTLNLLWVTNLDESGL